MVAKSKKTRVTRKFLLDIAERIYDPKSRRFIRLCTESLVNGPDPTNPKRRMHCGLGEIYFAMTGKEPVEDSTDPRFIDDNDVIDEIIGRSSFATEDTVLYDLARHAIKRLDLEDGAEEDVLEMLADSWNHDNRSFYHKKDEFHGALNDIIEANEDIHGNACSFAEFRSRATRVAKQIKKAALLLPE